VVDVPQTSSAGLHDDFCRTLSSGLRYCVAFDVVVFVITLYDTALSVAIKLSLRGTCRNLMYTMCTRLYMDAAY
jgi:hypothetical protein